MLNYRRLVYSSNPKNKDVSNILEYYFPLRQILAVAHMFMNHVHKKRNTMWIKDSIYVCNVCMYVCMYCDRTPPWFPTTCNMFWYKDFLCCFFHFHFVRISSDFSSGALWQNVLPQDFATNSFVRISLGFRQNLNWSNEIFDEISTEFSRSFFVAKGVAKWIATRIATKSSTKALTNSQRPTDVIPFLLQIMSSTNTIHTYSPYKPERPV